MRYNFKDDSFEITLNEEVIQISSIDVLFAVNEYLQKHFNEIGLDEDGLHIATIKREVIETNRWYSKKNEICYSCQNCNSIGNDEVLICCSKESEMYNKEISKFGTCEFYKSQCFGENNDG